MNTVIKEQKFFKDVVGVIFCIDIMEMNADSWCEEIQEGWQEISAHEAMLLANPPPTQEQLIEQVSAQKQTLISEATAIIEPLKDALEGGYIDDADKPRLTTWQKYRYEVTKVDLAKPVWPVKPAA
ncbi:tail fiber assembly protein [Citrobacter sp. Cb028]|uniref:tail fiber assembly protein n=1 Tax=Enterobacteriaceae TaxID=543 RepID=UPI0025775962|nr:tail fiber assembly protein [Citrobacter sp. Cb028]MDM3454459.1 tail fiber assembly protein [Citrobacter sp. Cb028]